MKTIGVLFLVFTALFSAHAQDSSGQIAYVGTDYNIYTLVPPSGSATALTDDAAISQTSAQVYEWPTWSTDGRLAYFRSSLDSSGGVTTDVMVSPDAQVPGESVYTGEGEGITYAYWSPNSCGGDCRELAVLLTTSSDLLVKLVHLQDGAATSSTIGRGGPFYYSWSPDGTHMLWQLNNREFDIFDTTSSKVTDTLAQTPGMMFTPGWSPVDDRLLLGVQNQTATDLVISSDDNVMTLVSGQSSPLWFSWSPDGSHVAYIDRKGPLIVLDASTGEESVRSPVSGALAFFWSPDSQHVAYITLATSPGSFDAAAINRGKIAAPAQQDSSGLAWSILDIADGANRRYGSFQPTSQEGYLLTYFDQFSQSHRVWSPDSRELVYSEITADQRRVISLLDTTDEASIPLVVADGILGVWSFN